MRCYSVSFVLLIRETEKIADKPVYLDEDLIFCSIMDKIRRKIRTTYETISFVSKKLKGMRVFTGVMHDCPMNIHAFKFTFIYYFNVYVTFI